MARGMDSVNAQLEAWLRVQATNGEIIECLIDTGFNGALVINALGHRAAKLTVLGRVPIIGVGRARMVADIAEQEIKWLNQTGAVEVIISDGDDSLLGAELLDGSRLVIDFTAHTVTVSD